MSYLIDYVYIWDVVVIVENVEFFFFVVDQFYVLGLVKFCCDFLIFEFFLENCIGICWFVKIFFCYNLERVVFCFFMLNIVDVLVYSNEYFQLGIGEFCDILLLDELNVRNEEFVFDVVLWWIDFDVDYRRDYIVCFLKIIRFGFFIMQYFVEKVKVYFYIKDNDFCKLIIIEILKFLYDLDMDEDKELDLNNFFVRLCVLYEILFVIGGWSGGLFMNIVEIYDICVDCWIVCDVVDIGECNILFFCFFFFVYICNVICFFIERNYFFFFLYNV